MGEVFFRFFSLSLELFLRNIMEEVFILNRISSLNFQSSKLQAFIETGLPQVCWLQVDDGDPAAGGVGVQEGGVAHVPAGRGC